MYLFFGPQQTVAYDTFDLKLGLFGVVGCCIRFSTADFVMIATYLLISPMLAFFMLSYVLHHLAALVALGVVVHMHGPEKQQYSTEK